MSKFWKIINALCWLALTFALAISCSMASAAVNQGKGVDKGISAEKETGITADEDSSTSEAGRKKAPFDAFAWITVGIGIGSFGAIAHLKFNGQKRKIKGSQIETLSARVAETSAVSHEITRQNESADPMEGNVHRIDAAYEERVRNLEAKKKAMVAETSRTAIEILRIWG